MNFESENTGAGLGKLSNCSGEVTKPRSEESEGGPNWRSPSAQNARQTFYRQEETQTAPISSFPHSETLKPTTVIWNITEM